MKLPRVSVLMSTYNGEKYIREQIDSILRQESVEVQLLIRDDGSSDNTPLICKEYEKKYSNVSFYQGCNTGIGKSFMELLRNAPEAEFYSFADQDDVWLADKLIRAVIMIREAETKIPWREVGGGYPITCNGLSEKMSVSSEIKCPILYGSNLIKVDEKLNLVGLRFESIPKCDLLSSISSNMIYGCTMVMNRLLREISVSIDNPSDKIFTRKNHDGWVLYVSYITGIFIYDSESHIYYREHVDQAVGVKETKGIRVIEDFFNRLFKAKNKGIRSTLAKDLLEKLSDRMNTDIRVHLEILSKTNTVRGTRDLIKDKDLVDSFGESRGKILLRGMIKWI